jgi:uncharacterized protein YrrD
METSVPIVTGSDVYDKNGAKVGTITDVVFEATTLKPEWYDVKVGMFAGHRLIPADRVTVEEGHGVVPFDKKVVKSAPDRSLPLLEEDKKSLLEHYKAA